MCHSSLFSSQTWQEKRAAELKQMAEKDEDRREVITQNLVGATLSEHIGFLTPLAEDFASQEVNYAALKHSCEVMKQAVLTSSESAKVLFTSDNDGKIFHKKLQQISLVFGQKKGFKPISELIQEIINGAQKLTAEKK